MEFLNYFYDSTNKLPKTNLKSGQICEIFFKNLFDLYFEKTPNYQQKNKHFRYDFSTNHIIYELKNYLYDSTGTADEKILYNLYKYTNQNYDIIFILCAKFEKIFYDKYLNLFIQHNFINDLLNKNVFITFASDMISDYKIYT